MTLPELPFQVAGYRILRRLGRGGMATVYLAIQQSLARPVAIKVLSSEHAPSDAVAQRFEREARTIAQLDHPNIVSIFDVGRTSAGNIYYTMPYLPNGDLASRDLHGQSADVLGVVRALAEALACAHGQGIVHRDVKPENVLFDRLNRPLLADFGIALGDTSQPRVTREGATVGSSGYMSPEQARGQAVDGRSDLYSLGVLCHELLTGELPFHGTDALATALAHIEQPIPRMPVTRRVWQPLIDKALAKQPDARFQSAEEMLASLDVIERQLKLAQRKGSPRWWARLMDRTATIPRRQRALALGGAIVIVLAALLALVARAPVRITAPDLAPALVDPTAGASHDASAPGLDSSVAQPPSAPNPGDNADATEATAAAPAAREQRLEQASELFASGRLVRADGKDAASQYLAILEAEPQQPDALDGVARILTKLSAQAVKAIDSGAFAESSRPIEQGADLARRAGIKSGKILDAFVAPVHRAVDKATPPTRDPFDIRALDAIKPLLPALLRIDAKQAHALEARLRSASQLLQNGGAFTDRNGPRMRVVPAARAVAAGVDHAFAVTVGDVSRAEYAQFAQASGRAPASCRESPRLFARSRGLSWRTPGFAQGEDHPVVCVSWNDAFAYARWLSQRTGAHYRLPTAPEWLLLARAAGAGLMCDAVNIAARSGAAAHCDDGFAQTSPIGRFPATPPGIYDISGNVSVWLADCARPGDCREHVYRGLSWRDDDDQSNLKRADSAGSDVGYANIGFRLVRDIPVRANAG